MIRITGGEWNRRKLRTPRGEATRPTPARVRQALFNVLGETVRDHTFYDLYAGSGAVGLEALSRGAPHVVFVETARPALACLRRNLEAFECGDRAEIVAQRLPAWLIAPGPSPDAPSMLFLDPPYYQGFAAATLETLARRADAPAGGLCVAQTEKEAQLAESYGHWHVLRRYPHGDSALWLYEQTP